MKMLSRVLIILMAAFAVIGATYAISQTAAAQTLTGSAAEMGQIEDRPAPFALTNDQSTLSTQFGSHPDGGGEGRDGWQTLGQNLLKIAVIVAAVQVVWSIGRWLKRTTASLTRRNRLSPNRA